MATMLPQGYKWSDVTTFSDYSDIDFNMYCFDIDSNSINVTPDNSILGNRVFYSAASDAFGRCLKMQKTWNSSNLYNVFMMYGGIYIQDNTATMDSRIFLVYTDPNTGEIIEVKSNGLIDRIDQQCKLSTEPKCVMMNSSAFVNTSEDDTAGFFVSVGGLEIMDVSDTTSYFDISNYSYSSDIYRISSKNGVSSKIDITDILQHRYGHSIVYINNKLYTYGGAMNIQISDFSNMEFNKDISTTIYTNIDTDLYTNVTTSNYCLRCFQKPSLTGYEKYLTGKDSGYDFGDYTNAFDATRSFAGKDGWFRYYGDTSSRIKVKKAYIEVSGAAYGELVIIGQLSGIVYENKRQKFPIDLDLTNLLGIERSFFYIRIPQWASITRVYVTDTY